MSCRRARYEYITVVVMIQSGTRESCLGFSRGRRLFSRNRVSGWELGMQASLMTCFLSVTVLVYVAVLFFFQP